MADQMMKKKIKGVADVVICLDATGSMQPCIDALKARIGAMFDVMAKPINVNGADFTVTDWRARLVVFRDLDTDPSDKALVEFPFINTKEALVAQLADPAAQHFGGGDEPESLLDGVYRATRSEWRNAKEAHRFVIVFSDATAKPMLHESTAGAGLPKDAAEVIQALKTQMVKLVLFARRDPVTEKLLGAVKKEGVKKASHLFASYEEAVSWFQSDDKMLDLMASLGASLSQSASEVL